MHVAWQTLNENHEFQPIVEGRLDVNHKKESIKDISTVMAQ